jgi:hypothetical protein
VTTEGEEMEMPASVVANQSFARGTKVKSRFGLFQDKGSDARKPDAWGTLAS